MYAVVFDRVAEEDVRSPAEGSQIIGPVVVEVEVLVAIERAQLQPIVDPQRRGAREDVERLLDIGVRRGCRLPMVPATIR